MGEKSILVSCFIVFVITASLFLEQCFHVCSLEHLLRRILITIPFEAGVGAKVSEIKKLEHSGVRNHISVTAGSSAHLKF